MASDNQRLDSLLNSATKASQLPDELSYIITSFTPSKSQDERSKAYLVLSAFCQGVRQSHSNKSHTSDTDPATEALSKVFSPLILARLEETNEENLLVGISFLTALFQVDWQSASAIFTQATVLELVMDSIEFKPSPQLSLNVAQLLSQACGYKPSRTHISEEAISWLERSRNSQDTALRAAASIALIKLTKGRAADRASDPTAAALETKEVVDDGLVEAMKKLVIDRDSDSSSLSDAIEGLAYTSTDPTVKEDISKDTSFLKQLFSLVPKQKAAAPDANSALLYGIVVMISNLCAHRPQLTEEQKQIEKLRKMAKNNSGGTDAASALDDDDKVKERIKRVVAAGALEVLVAAVLMTDTPGIRLIVGKAFLDIVTDKENRGKVLQHGGAKVLMMIIKKSMSSTVPPSKSAKDVELDEAYLPPVQALAKLAITSSPVQVFGPDAGALYDAIRPLSLMLQHPSATQLQRFESLMALTNLASANPESATRVADSKGLLNRVEFLLLDDHPLVQRAAVELICNLIVGSDKVYETYASSKSKLQIILALSDAEDLQTRLAASGALATLLSLPKACQELLSLQQERHRVLPILTQLIDPSSATDGEPASETHPGLVHRGVICTRHFILGIENNADLDVIRKEAQEAGLVSALGKIVKDSSVGPEIVRPAVEALKVLLKKADK
ncbi:SWI5-dependent HO expression protein 4 [Paramarasmius palmivorus]|uniref:SWI5-dependent HO expression protein 4 n=1 Tax=Paramarasmius palmivorus TaxID=297713 RepID=A0AAW0E2N4_9AGAR